jgi:DNA-binding LacI/PurR family transcriptional regulator
MAKSNKVRIQDIADATNYSLMTVSVALNPRPSVVKISDSTREKIQKTARKMGYYPNMNARILGGCKSNVIGVMIPSLRDNFYSELLMRIDTSLHANKLTGLYTFWSSYEEFEQSLSALKNFGVRGVITMHDLPAEYPPDVPVICYGIRHQDYESIYPDMRQGINLGVNHLVELGHRNLGFIGSMECKNREIYFKDALDKRQLPVNPDWIISIGKGADHGCAGIRKILASCSRLPDALICSSDERAFSTMVELQNNGIVIPRNISIIGINNLSRCEDNYPSLTSLDFHLSELGNLLVERLLELSSNPELPRQDTVLDCSLKIRNSCTCAANCN